MFVIDWRVSYIKSNEYREMPTICCSDLDDYIQIFQKVKPEIVYIFENSEKKEMKLGEIIKKTILNIDVKKINHKNIPKSQKDMAEKISKSDREKLKSDRFYLNNTEREFGFIYDSILLTIKSYNYSDISNFFNGVSLGFYDETIYLKAKEGGFSSLHEYNSLIDIGFKTKREYLKAIDDNFFTYFEEYKKNYLLNIVKFPFFERVSDLYYQCKSGGFESYNQFLDALKRGFSNKIELDRAISGGFETKKDYDIAIKNGFELKDEFEKAKSLGIKSKNLYDIYENLIENAQLDLFNFVDISFVYSIISQFEDGDKISINRLIELTEEFKSVIQKDISSKKNAEWFKTSLKTRESFKKLLSENSEFNSLGIYDNDGEFFEKLLRGDLKVVIDGSNVAWNSNSQKNSDYPELKNISLVVQALKKQNIKDITVIIDAALMYKVKDPEFYKEFEDMIHKAPAKTEADYFIISFAKSESGLIVTNDQFKDWREKDSWIQDNIENILVPFMILNGRVTFGRVLKNTKGINNTLNSINYFDEKTKKTSENSYIFDEKTELILVEIFDFYQKKEGLFFKEFERLYIEKFGNNFQNFKNFRELLESKSEIFEITFKFNKHNLYVKKRALKN